MFLKKSLLTLSTVSMAMALTLFAGCSSSDDDKNNPVIPDEPITSSDATPVATSSSAITPADTTANASSSSETPAQPASSSSDNTPDTPLSSMQYEDEVTYVSITEIMYNAPDKSELEWVELKIVSGKGVKDMSWDLELRLSGAISYTFPAEPLTEDEYLVVTNNPDLFKATYPNFNGRLFGPWDVDAKTNAIGKLENEGDVIDVKVKGRGDMSCAFGSQPPWTSRADGNGSTLVYIGGNPAQAAAWGASLQKWGNPGGPDEYIKPTSVRINEIQPFILGSEPGWMELYNAGDQDVDISGWILKSKLQGKECIISSGVVPAKGYLVLDPSVETTFSCFDDSTKTFKPEVVYFNSNGGEYYLYETVGGEKTGTESSLLLAASNKSSGIVDVSDGSTSQGALMEATPGKANSILKAGPVFINELYYHPPEVSDIPFEFLELINKSEADVNLYVTKDNVSKGWKIEGVNLEFEQGTIIKAGGLLVVVSDTLKHQEAELRKIIPEDVPIAYCKGKLSNRGEMIAVKEPFSFSGTGTSIQWYYDWSDATLYSDNWEGLLDADGFGKSLQRTNFTTMGHESKAWTLADPTPGK